ncbi:MAG: hypothetical protein HRT87_12095, partial [Legionellales bacterium]|nr:hypothetical protein [Legionellales bacterium]
MKKLLLPIVAGASFLAINPSISFASFVDDFYNASGNYDQNSINKQTLNEAWELYNSDKLEHCKRKLDRLREIFGNKVPDDMKEKFDILNEAFENNPTLIVQDDIYVQTNSEIKILLGSILGYIDIGHMEDAEVLLNEAIVLEQNGAILSQEDKVVFHSALDMFSKKHDYNQPKIGSEDEIQFVFNWTDDALPEDLYNSFDCVILEQFEHPNILIDQTYINAFAALKPGGTLLFHGYRPIDYFGLAR